MNQVITDQDVYIPEQIFQYIVSVIKRQPNKQLYRFSYQNLFRLALNYDYQKAAELKEHLAKYSDKGFYYILLCDYDFGLYKKNLVNIMSNEQIIQCYKTMYNTFGLTKYGFTDVVNTAYNKNCISFLNKSLLKLDDWIGTLEHEMTHFIQRVIGLDQTVQHDYQEIVNKAEMNENIEQKIYAFAVRLSLHMKTPSDDIADILFKKITYLLSKNQIQETIKSLLLMFENMYKRNIEYVNGKIKEVTIKTKDIKDRIKWLNAFLKKVNATSYLDTIEFRNGFQLWRKKSIKCNEEELINHRYFSYILAYLSIKNILPECDIDKKLEEHFKEF